MNKKVHENRVVVTGMGIVSCIGNDKQTVVESLREGRSGIQYVDEYETLNLRSRVAGVVEVDAASQIERKRLPFDSLQD